MITVYHLTDATPAVIIGMLVLWAAASKRHWFLRTAVLGAVVLVALLIPAFEVVIQLAVQCALVVIALAIWKRRRARGMQSAATRERSSVDPPAPRFRISMETLLLAMAVVAVFTAVAARAPQLTFSVWSEFVANGFLAAAVCIGCVWVVYGRWPWLRRVLAIPLLIFGLTALLIGLRWLGWFLNSWLTGQSWQPNLYTNETILHTLWMQMKHWVIVIGLGMIILCVWLYVARLAAWFDPFDEQFGKSNSESRRRIEIARWAVVAFFLVAALFPARLFYRLMTPTPIPQVELPSPNGYDDFIAAGQMIGPIATAQQMPSALKSVRQLGSELVQHEAAFTRMQAGFRKRCCYPYMFAIRPAEDVQALQLLEYALNGRANYLLQVGDDETLVQHHLDLLRLAHAEARGAGFPRYFADSESPTCAGIWQVSQARTAEECIALAAELADLEQQREPWTEIERRQRIVFENSGWRVHVSMILTDWSTNEGAFVTWWKVAHLKHVTALRMLILKLAIRAYQLESGKLPPKLVDLVPKYLQTLPVDPFDEKEFIYQPAADNYQLYSVGADGVFDGGQRLGYLDANGTENGTEVGDISDSILFPTAPLLSTSNASQPSRAAPPATNNGDSETKKE